MSKSQPSKPRRITPEVREQIRAALVQAVAATAERNKARRLPADFLNRRITV